MFALGTLCKYTGITWIVIIGLAFTISSFPQVIVDDVYNCPRCNVICLLGVAPKPIYSADSKPLTQATFEFVFPGLRSFSRASFDFLFPELSEKCDVYREIERKYSLNLGGTECSERLSNAWKSIIACEIGSPFEEPVDKEAIGFHLDCDSRIEKIQVLFKDCEELQYLKLTN